MTLPWWSYPVIAINLLSFLLFGFDKYRALAKGRRVPEVTLYIITLLGGSLGSLLGMYTFRHKTSKKSFQIVIALILLIQLAIAAYLLQN
jgi:uncharacterized membrane protein YsdA (DUF1294 family)